MYNLIGESGSLTGQSIGLKDQMLFGRSPDCDQVVSDANVSRHHCRFLVENHSLIVHDLNSSNGTFVNEVRIQGRFELHHGDKLRIGDTCFLVQKAPPPQDVVSIIASRNQIDQSTSATQLGKRLTAVLKMSEALGTLRTTEELFQKLLLCLFDVFPQATRGFLLLGNELDHLKPVATRYRRSQDTTGKIDISRSIVGNALKEGTAVLFTESGDRLSNESILVLKIRSAMVVPLIVKDEILGVLSVDTDDVSRRFTSDDLAVANAAASQASIALKNALLNEQVETDFLIRQNLCRFLPAPLTSQAMEGKLDLKLGGSRCKGTIFFSDVVGFTSMSETLSPEAVVGVLNAYFDLMVGAIADHQGAIDKYMGDAIMAFWGIPLDLDGQAAVHACMAGLQMQNLLWIFNYELQAQGKPELGQGIGINTGEVIAGNIGSSRRVEYTVIGDNVNLAQRLESGAARSQVLISENTYQETQGVALGMQLAPSKVKGKHELIRPISLRGVVKDATSTLLHLPLMTDDQVPVLLTELQTLPDGTVEFKVVHPEHYTFSETLVHPNLPEAPDLLPFQLKGVESQVVTEGEHSQRRYGISRALPLSWDIRLRQLILDHRLISVDLTLDGFKRH